MVDMEKLERMATKAVDKTIGKIIPKMSLEQQVKMTRSFMRQLGVPETRRRIINGLEEEFKEEREKNPEITTDELVKKYTDCPEFMKLWQEWGLDEMNLRVLAEGKCQ